QERGPILLCSAPDQDGVFQHVQPYGTQVTNCQGMCWVDDALLLVGQGPKGVGLYRVRDTNGDDRIDEVELLHQVKGGMGEHGPHAIIHGPDNWLYFVLGNHAWAQPDQLAGNSPLTRWPKGVEGIDQGKPGTTEDVLLPRQNDARGHAANRLAPGGTIWRLDKNGRNMSLVAAGFRNQFDAAFSPFGELFSFDSDMEWDEALPWYRPVRVVHCPPGAELGWRTGSSKIPAYALDTLPPILETGRGSPVGVEFYNHVRFPEKYRGAFFIGDWSLGVIYAVHLERDGASYQAKGERFCQGAPLNVTDLAVGPDGALYFTMGGRGTQGGVYRIVYESLRDAPFSFLDAQPTSAYSRDILSTAKQNQVFEQTRHGLRSAARDPQAAAAKRIQALMLLQMMDDAITPELVLPLLSDQDAEVRACAVWLAGVRGFAEGRKPLLQALTDDDALVRRRACEALVRAGIEPPVEALWPLLGDPDRFVRTAARLVAQRIDPRKWAKRIAAEPNDLVACEAIVALCKMDQEAPRYSGILFDRLNRINLKTDAQGLLDFLRTLQLALIHAAPSATSDVKALAAKCYPLFPNADWRVNRELAVVLTHCRKEGLIQEPVHRPLLDALLARKDDRAQQIHYFYCLRFLKDGWTSEQKADLLTWFDATRDWTGGMSFSGFLENILRDASDIFTPDDVERLIAQGDKQSWAAMRLLRLVSEKQLPQPEVLARYYAVLAKQPALAPADARATVVATLGKYSSPQAANVLRQLADDYPQEREVVARGLARFPTPENWPYLVQGLESNNPLILFDVIEALKKIDQKPKPEEGAPFRALLLASKRLDAQSRWRVVELLRHWTGGRQFGAEDGDAPTELASWSKWFAQSFPKEKPLPDLVSDQPVESKYKFDELLAFLEKEDAGRNGDVKRGRLVFEKAQCLKCHKFGDEGEGIGPDLTTLSKRFKRSDTLEALFYPSKVISDQYRASVVITTKGQALTGLLAPQGDMVTILQNDGSKLTLHKDDIEQQFASLVSVMPEKLLDTLTKEEIADLFAFLESMPPMTPGQ
ncbi:MAG: HEAT repeat domain-containing protein, partial [Gemmataceae bacterium]